MCFLAYNFAIILIFAVFTARRYATAVYAVVVCLTVRLSVRHKPALYQNGQIVESRK